MNKVTEIIINRTGCSRHKAEETTVALSNAGLMKKKNKQTQGKEEKEQSKERNVEISEVTSTKGAPY